MPSTLQQSEFRQSAARWKPKTTNSASAENEQKILYPNRASRKQMSGVSRAETQPTSTHGPEPELPHSEEAPMALLEKKSQTGFSSGKLM